MSRYAHKVDASQNLVMEALQKCGVTVRNVSGAGNGLLDLICCDILGTFLVDAKSEGGKLTEAQQCWLADWPGDWYTATTIDDVVKIVNKRRTQR